MARGAPNSTPFPSRRSSDLPHPAADRAVERQQAAVHALQRLARIRAQPFAQVTTVALETVEGHGRAAHRGFARSEEHTSELQSRRDLVCRLLLEKKINIVCI